MSKFRIYFFVISLLILNSCSLKKEEKKHEIKNGMLNLSEIKLNKKNIIQLKGEWEFYYKQLITPNEFENLHLKPIYLNEGYWNSIEISNKKLPRTGYATYRLQIICDREYPNAYFESGEIFTSSKVWINNELIYEQGKVSKEPKTSKPESFKKIYPIKMQKGKNIIVIQASNYSHRNAGMIVSPRIGLNNLIIHEKELKLAWTFFIFGILLVLAFYHFVIVISAHSNRMALYFGVFLVLIALHTTVISEEAIRILFQDISWSLILRIEFTIFFVSSPIFGKFIFQFLRDELDKRVFDFFLYFGIALSFLCFLLPSYLFSFLIIPFYFVLLFVSIYLFIGLFIALKRKRNKIMFLLLFFAILTSTVLFDVLIALEVIHSERITPIGFFIFSILFTIFNVRNLYNLMDENKEIQIKLQHENLLLEKLVSERTIKLSEIHENLKELNLQKDKFISIISHDLKNPISGIKTATNFFVLKFQKLDMKMLHQKFAVINESIINIYALLEDLLEWSSLQTGKMMFNPSVLDLNNLVLKNISLVKQMALKKNLTILTQVQARTLVFADSKMVDTILRNLLVNAIKFSYENNQIIIGANKLENNKIEVFVKDFGVGISEEKKDNLLKLEKPISSRGTLKEKGTGLGLILCDEFARIHDSQIFIKSKANEGSTFSFILSLEL